MLHRHPRPAPHSALRLALIGPFALAAKSRDIPARLDALKQQALARIPCTLDGEAQDIDAAAPHYDAMASARAAGKAVPA